MELYPQIIIFVNDESRFRQTTGSAAHLPAVHFAFRRSGVDGGDAGAGLQDDALGSGDAHPETIGQGVRKGLQRREDHPCPSVPHDLAAGGRRGPGLDAGVMPGTGHAGSPRLDEDQPGQHPPERTGYRPANLRRYALRKTDRPQGRLRACGRRQGHHDD